MGEIIRNTFYERERRASFCRAERVAAFAADISAGLLSSGASVGAAEEAASRACAAYGIKDAQVCAVPSAVTVCASFGGVTVTRLKRIYYGGNDLYILEKYGSLLREACGGLPIDEAEKRLDSVSCVKGASALRQSVGGGLACGAFCAFFGGGLCDFALSGIIGVITSLIAARLSKKGAGGCARTLLLSAVGGALSVALCAACDSAGIYCSCSLVMLGSIMTLIPGLALCNALRDILSGDFFSGVYRIAGGLAATAAIVAGYAFAASSLSGISVFNPFSPLYGGRGVCIKYASCAAGAAGFCVMMNVRFKRLLCGVSAALLSYSVYLLSEWYCGEFCAFFLASAVAYFSSAALAAAHKIPAGVFLTPAVMPLLPGAALYYAVDALASGDAQTALVYGWDALYIFASIAAGLSAAAVAARLLRGARARFCLRRVPKVCGGRKRLSDY